MRHAPARVVVGAVARADKRVGLKSCDRASLVRADCRHGIERVLSRSRNEKDSRGRLNQGCTSHRRQRRAGIDGQRDRVVGDAGIDHRQQRGVGTGRCGRSATFEQRGDGYKRNGVRTKFSTAGLGGFHRRRPVQCVCLGSSNHISGDLLQFPSVPVPLLRQRLLSRGDRLVVPMRGRLQSITE